MPVETKPASGQQHSAGWEAFRRTLTRYDRSKIHPWVAARSTIGAVLPLTVGALTQNVPGAVLVATGAVNASFRDDESPYQHRARWLLWTALSGGAATFLGCLAGDHAALAVLVIAAWSFGAGMLVSIDTGTADVGNAGLVLLSVFLARPQTPPMALVFGALVLAGGVLQTALSIALWPVRRFAPERRTLSSLYGQLANIALAQIDFLAPPSGDVAATQAQQALTQTGRGRSLEAERYRVLLNEAERIRLGLLMLNRLRHRIQRIQPDAAELEGIERFRQTAAHVLQAVSVALLDDRLDEETTGRLAALTDISEQFAALPAAQDPAIAATWEEVRSQMDSLAGLLRASVDLARADTQEGWSDFAERQGHLPWRLRLGGRLATLQANLTPRSAAFRHAVRLAVCMGLAEALGRSWDLQRSYWFPMTVSIVLRPEFTTTFSRGVLRLAGTFGGLLLATAIVHLLPETEPVQIGLIGVLTFLMRSVGAANYGLLVVALSAYVVILIALSGVPPGQAIAARAINTCLGGILALAAYRAWPTWEREQVGLSLAEMLEAYRAYFRAVADSYLEPGGIDQTRLEQARLGARLARSNAEASVDRLKGEPGAKDRPMDALHGMMANSHRFIHAVMALEAGLSRSHSSPARPAFRQFSQDVDFTLYFFATALRDTTKLHLMLPDLRRDYRALVHSGDSHDERYALVNVEADRVANSLNTFRQQLMQWAGGSGEHQNQA